MLQLYPAEYRQRFGEGMRGMLAQDLTVAAGRGWIAVIRFWTRSAWDAVTIGLYGRTIPHLRGHRRPGGPGGGQRGRGRGSLPLWIASVLQDLRYAFRSLMAQPSFTGMTLLALVVGIGLNTSLFATLNALLFRPWDVADPERVVQLLSRHPQHGYGGLPIASSSWLAETAGTIEGAFSQRFTTSRLDGAPDGQPVAVALVSGTYFDVLRVALAHGRAFAAHEDVPVSPSAVAVISHALWSERYDADSAAIGSEIRLDDVAFTVIGVVDESFDGTGAQRPALWVPLSAMVLLRASDPGNLARLTDPEFCCSDVYARLSPGSTRQEAEAELTALYRRFSIGAQQDAIDVAVIGTAAFDHPDERQRGAAVVAIAMTAFGSILLLACANVSNMFLARTAAREREITLRMAIGAARGRIIRQLLTEGLVLSGMAGAASLLLAPALPRLVFWLRGAPLQPLEVSADATVLTYAAGISVLAAVAFGLTPALRATRASMSESLKGRSIHARASMGLRGMLICVQVTVSVALLGTAGLLLRGLDRAGTLDPGFRTRDVTAIRVQLPRNAYDRADERRFFDNLLMRLESAGRAVGMAALMPLGETQNFTDFVAPESPLDAGTGMAVQDVTAGYLEVLDIPLLLGRTFQAGDRAAGAILVNESLARRHWPARSAIGEVVTIGGRLREIVGVVGDAQLHGIGNSDLMYFAPFEANGLGVGEPPIILVPSPLASGVIGAVRAAEPGAVVDVIDLSEQADRSLGDSRGVARVIGALAWVALLLASCGVYAVTSYSVEQRRREMGMRMALGARPRELAGLILRRNAPPVVLGLVAGLSIAAAGTIVLRSQLYGLHPLDPWAASGVFLVLLLAGAAASAIPVRRVLKVDPVQALQGD